MAMKSLHDHINNALNKFYTKLKSNVIDSLVSTSTTLPLSANQGRILNNKITTLNKNVYATNTLWSGTLFMNADHVITLSQKISEQKTGIVLVFSLYADGAASNSLFSTHFVPKELVAQKPGCGHQFFGANGYLNFFRKYLYISDQTIKGHEDNNKSGTMNNLNYINNSFVLRYVYGV